jgi:hypothetical protein
VTFGVGEPYFRGHPKGLSGAAAARNIVLFCGLRKRVATHGLPGGAEGIRTDGHRGRGEISSWIAALKAALGGGPAFRRAASRYRGRRKDLRRHLSLRSRRRKEPKASAENTGIARRRHPEELPIDPLENTIPRLRSSAGMRKHRSFETMRRRVKVLLEHPSRSLLLSYFEARAAVLDPTKPAF